MGRLIVDGYNAIRRDEALRKLEQEFPLRARAQLLRLLNRPSLSKYSVLVVFDGSPPPGESLLPGRVRVVHSREETADAVIARVARALDIVVTDDHGLRADTLLSGPRVWSTQQLFTTVRPAGPNDSKRASVREEVRTPKVPALRAFSVCPTCMFYTRDDWIRLCEDDGLLGRPANYREHW
ncbi:MAG: NYN domain-containing protein [Chloroflexota bacterium]|nr:NYN domain-containing protein [Chloroflexota bacterium]